VKTVLPKKVLEYFKTQGARGPKERKSTRIITPAQQAALQKARRKAKRSARLPNVPMSEPPTKTP
jgi:hypothetical protein